MDLELCFVRENRDALEPLGVLRYALIRTTKEGPPWVLVFVLVILWRLISLERTDGVIGFIILIVQMLSKDGQSKMPVIKDKKCLPAGACYIGAGACYSQHDQLNNLQNLEGSFYLQIFPLYFVIYIKIKNIWNMPKSKQKTSQITISDLTFQHLV